MQTNQQELLGILTSTGLHQHEAEIYLDLIKNGKSSPYDISKRLDIHRSNIYDILDKLQKKSIVEEIIINDKKYYYPAEPKNFLDYHKRKEKKIETLVEELQKLQCKKKEERKIYVIEGLAGIKSLMENLVNEESKNKEIITYGTPKEIKEILGEKFLKRFHEERIKKEIKLRYILNKNASKKIYELNHMPLTEARFFTSDYDSTISTTICCEKVILTFWEIPLCAIVIEDSSISHSYNKYFEILWDESITFK